MKNLPLEILTIHSEKKIVITVKKLKLVMTVKKPKLVMTVTIMDNNPALEIKEVKKNQIGQNDSMIGPSVISQDIIRMKIFKSRTVNLQEGSVVIQIDIINTLVSEIVIIHLLKTNKEVKEVKKIETIIITLLKQKMTTIHNRLTIEM